MENYSHLGSFASYCNLNPGYLTNVTYGGGGGGINVIHSNPENNPNNIEKLERIALMLKDVVTKNQKVQENLINPDASRIQQLELKLADLTAKYNVLLASPSYNNNIDLTVNTLNKRDEDLTYHSRDQILNVLMTRVADLNIKYGSICAKCNELQSAIEGNKICGPEGPPGPEGPMCPCNHEELVKLTEQCDKDREDLDAIKTVCTSLFKKIHSNDPSDDIKTLKKVYVDLEQKIDKLTTKHQSTENSLKKQIRRIAHLERRESKCSGSGRNRSRIYGIGSSDRSSDSDSSNSD